MKKENKKPYIFIGHLKIIINRGKPGRYALYHDGKTLILREDPKGDFTVGKNGRKEISSSKGVRKFLFGYFYKHFDDKTITDEEWRESCNKRFKAMGVEKRKGTLVFKDYEEVSE